MITQSSVIGDRFFLVLLVGFYMVKQTKVEDRGDAPQTVSSGVVMQGLVTTSNTTTSNTSTNTKLNDRLDQLIKANQKLRTTGSQNQASSSSMTSFSIESFAANRSISTGSLPNSESEVINDAMNIHLEKHNSDTSLIASAKRNVHMTQTGIDRYITVKRKRDSPKNVKVLTSKKQNVEKLPLKNRFEVFADGDVEESDSENPNILKQENRKFKPPPIYLREADTHKVVQELKSSVLKNGELFHVTNLLRGKIHEVKIQTYEVNDYRVVINYYDAQNRNYYTYRLKSSKGLSVVIKGIDVQVETTEIRLKKPQPMIKVELDPSETTLKKGKIHRIYKLRYLYIDA